MTLRNTFPGGLNVNWQTLDNARKSYVFDLGRRLRSAMHVGRNGSRTNREFYEACLGQSRIVDRAIPDDAKLWEQDDPTYMTPQALAQWHKTHLYPDIIAYIVNEPDLSTPERLDAFIGWALPTMDAHAQVDVPFCLGNFGNAEGKKDDIEAGRWDRLFAGDGKQLPGIVHYSEAGMGYLGEHPYRTGSLSHGGGGQNIFDLLDVARMQPPWPGRDYIWREGHEWSNYHGTRFEWRLRRARQITGKGYNILGTEGTWDRLTDLEGFDDQGRPRLLNQLEAKFNGGVKLDQVLPWRKIWELWWKERQGWNDVRAGIEQQKHFATLMPPEFIGWALFTLDFNDLWDPNFNWLQWPEFLEATAAWSREWYATPPYADDEGLPPEVLCTSSSAKQEQPPVSTTIPTPGSYTLLMSEPFNVRSTHSTKTGTFVLFTVKNGDSVTVLPEAPVMEDGYIWVKIRRPVTSGPTEGWIAASHTGLQFVAPVAPVPAPPPVVVTPPAPAEPTPVPPPETTTPIVPNIIYRFGTADEIRSIADDLEQAAGHLQRAVVLMRTIAAREPLKEEAPV